MQIDKKYVKRLIRLLNKYCFSAGMRKYLQSHGISRLTAKERKEISDASNPKGITFRSYVNCSFKKAQEIIIEHRLQVERAIKAGDYVYEPPYEPTYILRLLTDYADNIAWAMLGYDISAVRNFFLDHKDPTSLEEQNWQSIAISLRQLNGDPHQFALAADLTSFLHVGDILLRNTEKNQIQVLEVKTGRVNNELLKILDLEKEEERDEHLRALFRNQEKPRALAQHIIRFAKQAERMRGNEMYWGSAGKERIDVQTGRSVRVTEEDRRAQSWYIAVKDSLSKSTNPEIPVVGIVDGCLFFAYGQRPIREGDLTYIDYVIRQKLQLDSPLPQNNIFNTMSVLGQGMVYPRNWLYASQLGLRRQQKLLSKEEFLLVFLDIPSLKQFLKDAGLEFELCNMKKDEQNFRDPIISRLFGHNKVPAIYKVVNGERKDYRPLGGIWGRIIFGFMPPCELVNIYNYNLKMGLL